MVSIFLTYNSRECVEHSLATQSFSDLGLEENEDELIFYEDKPCPYALVGHTMF